MKLMNGSEGMYTYTHTHIHIKKEHMCDSVCVFYYTAQLYFVYQMRQTRRKYHLWIVAEVIAYFWTPFFGRDRF